MSSQVSVLVSRVRLSTWLRVLLAGSFALLLVALVSSTAIRVTTSGWNGVAVAEIVGAIIAVVLLVSSVVASCTVRVTAERLTLSFWILFRATVYAADLAELRADRWNSWDFGGYGLKGGPKRGWLLNATADASGAGDVGVLIRTVTGRTYRVEVADPERFVAQAGAVLTGIHPSGTVRYHGTVPRSECEEDR